MNTWRLKTKRVWTDFRKLYENLSVLGGSNVKQRLKASGIYQEMPIHVLHLISSASG